MVINCHYCSTKAAKKTYNFVSNKLNPRTNKVIEVKDACFLECPNCSHTWMTEEQEAHIETEIAKQLQDARRT